MLIRMVRVGVLVLVLVVALMVARMLVWLGSSWVVLKLSVTVSCGFAL